MSNDLAEVKFRNMQSWRIDKGLDIYISSSYLDSLDQDGSAPRTSPGDLHHHMCMLLRRVYSILNIAKMK